MEINRPDDLGDIADLSLTLTEAKLLPAGLRHEVVAGPGRDQAVRRPDGRSGSRVSCVKDDRDHVVATLFGQVRVRLRRFRCAGCDGIEAGFGWPSHCRPTPELDQLQAHLSALMPYRVAADLLEQIFPVDAGKDPRHCAVTSLKIGEVLRNRAAAQPEAAAPAIVVTLDSTFLRSCEDGERPLEVRAGKGAVHTNNKCAGHDAAPISCSRFAAPSTMTYSAPASDRTSGHSTSYARGPR
jgi:hypothetical protein